LKNPFHFSSLPGKLILKTSNFFKDLQIKTKLQLLDFNRAQFSAEADFIPEADFNP